MINEYLINEEINKERLKSCCDENIYISFDGDIDDLSHVVSYSTSNNNLEDAKALSEVGDKIACRTPVILMDGASDFFARELFPLVNKFERMLRKTIYLYNDMMGSEKGSGRSFACDNYG